MINTNRCYLCFHPLKRSGQSRVRPYKHDFYVTDLGVKPGSAAWRYHYTLIRKCPWSSRPLFLIDTLGFPCFSAIYKYIPDDLGEIFKEIASKKDTKEGKIFIGLVS